MKKHILTATLLLSFYAAFAQKDETLIGKTGLRLTGVWGGPHIGLVGFDGTGDGMAGGYFGLEFSKSLTLGYAGANNSGTTTYNGQSRNYKLDYGGFLVSYAYQSHRVVHPRVSFIIGSGQLDIVNEPDDAVFVMQPSIGAEVNLFRWMRLGLEGGYRFVSNTSIPKPNDGELSDGFAQLSFRFGWSWGRD